jgi:hypothetical protein
MLIAGNIVSTPQPAVLTPHSTYHVGLKSHSAFLKTYSVSSFHFEHLLCGFEPTCLFFRMTWLLYEFF